ncbi:hypothetical protein ACOME3_007934 [Neoechinorhynchus agilis]
MDLTEYNGTLDVTADGHKCVKWKAVRRRLGRCGCGMDSIQMLREHVSADYCLKATDLLESLNQRLNIQKLNQHVDDEAILNSIALLESSVYWETIAQTEHACSVLIWNASVEFEPTEKSKEWCANAPKLPYQLWEELRVDVRSLKAICSAVTPTWTVSLILDVRTLFILTAFKNPECVAALNAMHNLVLIIGAMLAFYAQKTNVSAVIILWWTMRLHLWIVQSTVGTVIVVEC